MIVAAGVYSSLPRYSVLLIYFQSFSPQQWFYSQFNTSPWTQPFYTVLYHKPKWFFLYEIHLDVFDNKVFSFVELKLLVYIHFNLGYLKK